MWGDANDARLGRFDERPVPLPTIEAADTDITPQTYDPRSRITGITPQQAVKDHPCCSIFWMYGFVALTNFSIAAIMAPWIAGQAASPSAKPPVFMM